MLDLKALLSKILQMLQPPNRMSLGSVALPYTIPKTGILTVNIATRNVGSSAGAYLYLKINSLGGYQCTWNGRANGGQASMTIAVKKGDVITGVSNNIASAYWYLYPYYSTNGGGYLTSKPYAIFSHLERWCLAC